MIFKPLFTQKQVEKILQAKKEKFEHTLIMFLASAGENFVSHARRNGEYQNWTGNLRSSIGYVVINQGQVAVSGNFEAFAQSPKVKLVSFTVKKGKYAGKKVEFYSQTKGGDGSEGQKKGQMLLDALIAKYQTGMVLIGLVGMEYGKYLEAMGKDVIKGAILNTEYFIKQRKQSFFNTI
ncbi:MAG: hypothetical protein GX102_13760 [Porphyromonadaceae bacterium]|nr:hypothetical protein [Porphyromonadaceae bacterium]